MLTVAHGLDSRALTAIAALEREVVAADGGRLKLEWGVLERRTTFDVDLLWWDGDRLLGFLGVYAFGPPDVELAGMVAPAARRRGVGTALLESARPLVRARGYERLLLVTPAGAAPSSAGRAFAQRQGAELDHSEHFLVLGATPGGRTVTQLSSCGSLGSRTARTSSGCSRGPSAVTRRSTSCTGTATPRTWPSSRGSRSAQYGSACTGRRRAIPRPGRSTDSASTRRTRAVGSGATCWSAAAACCAPRGATG